ncbi:hypothetical protein [Desulfopila aestuarii]|uniref:Uncharacterized protein n=1 Tax=Desulfopila aestuarii DSM 18488 TaxID=1121416 RepID=A0A1M7YEN8_9BACT|nr:hypothetical protein [Desulfopila aestuarii]SHO50968.1 hypothetical protein SAMN02745220_03732 [Desulfopila aestuarii DSM 18488]
MADKKKKMAAALAAVNAYMQQEQEAVALQAAAAAPPPAPTDFGISQWSFSGRQEMMAMRRLVQLRVFDRFR